jgi:hypothetical protein
MPPGPIYLHSLLDGDGFQLLKKKIDSSICIVRDKYVKIENEISF